MNNNLRLLLLVPLAILISLSSCLKDECERQVTYNKMVPVYKTKDEIRATTVVKEAPRALENIAQFYYYNNHIFITERNTGIHIIDNQNPEAPQNIAFLNIDGAENMAVKDGILYVNNYIDLLAIDISDIQNPSLEGRTNDVFNPLSTHYQTGDILIEYVIEQVTETMDCQRYMSLREFNGELFDGSFFGNAVDFNTGPIAESSASGGTGTGGSMARFTIIGEHLYAVSQSNLDIISLQQPTAPVFVNTINLGWGIETIFPYGDKLFIGSNSGMFIYDNSNPEAPEQLSAFAHARACDPVFVKGNYAYVTLRDGTECQGFINQLDLVDISDLTNPFLVESFPMDNPHGLSIRGDHLMLCEGIHGLKAFDISDPQNLDEKQMDHYEGVHAFDAISLPGTAPITMVIGEDGFYQFLFKPDEGFSLLSRISNGK